MDAKHAQKVALNPCSLL